MVPLLLSAECACRDTAVIHAVLFILRRWCTLVGELPDACSAAYVPTLLAE
jgi:hypothetical protein